MNGYTPFKPRPNNALTNWAKQIHETAINKRRVLQSPNSLTTQTTQGVIVRPKPGEASGGGGNDKPVWL